MYEVTFGLKVESYNPAHAWFEVAIFSGPMHGRERTGKAICLRVNEFEACCKRLRPEVVTWLCENTEPPVWLVPWSDNPWGYPKGYRLDVPGEEFNAIVCAAGLRKQIEALRLEIADFVALIYDVRGYFENVPVPSSRVAVKQELLARLTAALGEEADDD